QRTCAGKPRLPVLPIQTSSPPCRLPNIREVDCALDTHGIRACICRGALIESKPAVERAQLCPCPVRTGTFQIEIGRWPITQSRIEAPDGLSIQTVPLLVAADT